MLSYVLQLGKFRVVKISKFPKKWTLECSQIFGFGQKIRIVCFIRLEKLIINFSTCIDWKGFICDNKSWTKAYPSQSTALCKHKWLIHSVTLARGYWIFCFVHFDFGEDSSVTRRHLRPNYFCQRNASCVSLRFFTTQKLQGCCLNTYITKRLRSISDRTTLRSVSENEIVCVGSCTFNWLISPFRLEIFNTNRDLKSQK